MSAAASARRAADEHPLPRAGAPRIGRQAPACCRREGSIETERGLGQAGRSGSPARSRRYRRFTDDLCGVVCPDICPNLRRDCLTRRGAPRCTLARPGLALELWRRAPVVCGRSVSVVSRRRPGRIGRPACPGRRRILGSGCAPWAALRSNHPHYRQVTVICKPHRVGIARAAIHVRSPVDGSVVTGR